MTRWKKLNRFQQVLFLFQAVLLVVFSVLYPIFTRQTGVSYRGALLLRSVQGESTVYSGKVDGTPVSLTVSPNQTLVFQAGESIPVSYTVTEDSTAVPEGNDMSEVLTGVEVQRDGEILFRGGWFLDGSFDYLVDQDSGTLLPTISVSVDGIQYDADGQPVERSLEPDASEVLNLVFSPTLVHRGVPWAYWIGTLLVVANAAAMFYADELFRFNLRFQIRDPERAEPSEWELCSRYVGWIVLAVSAAVVYILGLTELA